MNPFVAIGVVAFIGALVSAMVYVVKRTRRQRFTTAKVRGTLARRDKEFARLFGTPRRGR